MIEFGRGPWVVEEVEAAGRIWRLISAETSLLLGNGRTGTRFSYQRPLYVESLDRQERRAIVDYTMLARFAVVVVAVLMTVRSIFK